MLVRIAPAVSLASLVLAALASAQSPLVESVGPGCGGVGGAPTLTVAPGLVVGQPSQLMVRNLQPNSTGLMVMGWPRGSWQSVPLPTPLDVIGMTGCTLYPRPESVYMFPTGPGSFNAPVATPNLSVFAGAEAYAQVFFGQPGLNPAGVGATDGLHVRVGAGTSGGPNTASSVSQWGITWTFDHAYPVGQFCNGDWWVLGPVNIVSISPGCQDLSGRTVNGSMINPTPTGEVGYDSAMYGQYASRNWVYRSALNVALNVSTSNPLTLPPSTSLISTISQVGTPSNGSWSQIRTAAILTVLNQQPPADAFRPAYSGSDKTVHFRESQMDYNVLGRLTPASGAPPMTAVADMFRRVWLDHCPTWMNRFIHPVDNMRDYGRDISAQVGTGALMLNCDFTNAQKRDLLIGMVQFGIDTWANVQNGCYWGAEGGTNSGKKFPVLLAGRVLGDPAMLSMGTTYQSEYYGRNDPRNGDYFAEDAQTFYVQQTSPGVYNWGFGSYSSSHQGLPEWGQFHCSDPSYDRSDWMTDPYRRCCTANSWLGYCLATRVMGLQQAWNHPAFFDYVDRYVQAEVGNTPSNSWLFCWEPWQGTMWNRYRSQF